MNRSRTAVCLLLGALWAGGASVPVHSPERRPPRTKEVRRALARVFGSVLPSASARAERGLAGDFNGDESDDLLVPAVVSPELVRRLQGELPMWILQDPEARRASAASVAAALQPGDALLVVIHGYGRAGWRDPAARQTYLLALKGQAPSVVRRFATTALAASRPSDVMNVEEDVAADDAGKRLLCWTGARYVWKDAAGAALR